MKQKISKTWNIGPSITTGMMRGILPDWTTLSLVVAPSIIKWGVVLSASMPIYNHQILPYDNVWSGRVLFIISELALSYGVGFCLSFIYRYFILHRLLKRLKKFGATKQKIWEICRLKEFSATRKEIWEIADVFIKDLLNGNTCLIAEPLSGALQAAGTLELDNILTDLEGLSVEGKLSPMLRWRIIAWAEKFNDEINLIFPYDRGAGYDKQSGWWAQTLLPYRGVREWDANIRYPILKALRYADPDEGARLSAFIAEAATINERGMSDEDKKDFMALSNQAKKMADNILAAQTPLPIQNGKTSLDNSLDSLSNIRRILSEESAEALSVSAPV